MVLVRKRYFNNGIRTFQVKVRIVTNDGKRKDREIKTNAKNAKTAGFRAEQILRKQPEVKSARWLFVVDQTDGSIHY
ncbi:hypothetical protein SAMN05444280_108126 [Tangfeifania diversioriginum]|uniref:Uncharacterized protein n=1 Tax=Tangfeifania diversioriginum TaxID=1168035 RepID=A0A1M6FD46_9BACT|nr:hypothetical protein [Tangfeifania diversioriginum]SHI95658.1 hypothetical protein SAMN05444280_108126 [Tangfeifania diversioriginum]